MSTKIIPDWDIRDAILESGGTDAYRCYQCGNCMAVCPWYQVDAVIYPVYRVPQSVKLGAIMTSEDTDVIEQEVSDVYRCVGCESCTTWCPHEVSLPNIMRAIRRILVEFGSYPSELSESVGRISSSGNPFGEPRENRGAWADALELPAFGPDTEYLYSPCCVPAYDPRARKVAEATVAILERAGVSCGTLGDAESCCGEAIRRAGAEEVFQEVAGANIEAYRAAGAKAVLVTSPHCYTTFANEYGEFGGDFEVFHQTQLFHKLLKEGRLVPQVALDKKVVYHDPCMLGRKNGIYDEPREVLGSIPGLELVEIPCFNREHSLCCGGGSGGVWLERPKGERLSDVRIQQAVDTGAEVLAVACPYCLQMFEDSVKTMSLDIEVKDVSELLADSLEDVPS
jgi:Fe-S oxidoreductase